MPLDFSAWHIMVRVRRGAPPQRAILDAACEEVFTHEEDATAMLANWRAVEPLDDLFWLSWTVGSGHRYCGSSCRAIESYQCRAALDRVAVLIAPALLTGIKLCVAAMLGEYGEGDVISVRPSSPPTGG